jgi:aminoglycoside phosphotransferase family enzyme/predicted kinase
MDVARFPGACAAPASDDAVVTREMTGATALRGRAHPAMRCVAGRALIEALREPAQFGHPITGLEILETHISWILLTGAYAYKFKKPLDLGFLDYTTLAKRKICCEEELRLNRRLAPRHYLEVVPVAGPPSRPMIGGPGEALEYAVKMRQFAREAEFGQLAERGALTPESIDRVARRVADFHRTAATASGEDGFGSAQRIEADALANFAPVAEVLSGDPAALGRLRALQAWTGAAVEALHARFAERLHRGGVREGHGDLHLGNIVLDSGEPVIFDCIEFSAPLRWIDVMSEVAFLMMDLMAHGAKPLAWRFLNAYLEHTGDYAGLGVLRFYLVYRAMVRAKVAAIRAAQGGAVGRGEIARIGTLLDVATDCARPTAAALILSCGVSGSGKTWLSGELCELLGAVRIRSDVERKRLHEVSGAVAQPPGEGIYSEAATSKTYRRLAELAGAALEAGCRVIVDATCLRHEQRAMLAHCARSRRVPFVILALKAADASLRERIEHRARAGGDASDADLRVLDYQMSRLEPLDSVEACASLPVRTDVALDIGELAGAIQARTRKPA